MPKASPIQTSFNGGIQTPLLDGHINAPRRDSSYKDSVNLVPLKHGPLVRRGGTTHIMAQRSTAVTRSELIPFIYSDTQSYMLEISGDESYGSILRVYKDDALVLNADQARTISDISLSSGVAEVTVTATLPAGSYLAGAIVFFDGITTATELNYGYYKVKEKTSTTTFTLTDYNGDDITTLSTEGATAGTVTRPYNVVLPYASGDLFTADDLFRIEYVQSNDVMYLAHPDYPPQVLTRSGDASWSVEAIDFDNGPYFNNETGIYLTDFVEDTAGRVFDVRMDTATFSRTDTVFTASVTGVTLGSTTVIGATSHPFIAGDIVTITGITGTAELNDRTFVVASPVNANDFAIEEITSVTDTSDSTALVSSGYTAWSSGGTITSFGTQRLMQIYFENTGTPAKARYRWGRISDYTDSTNIKFTIDSDKKRVGTLWYSSAGNPDAGDPSSTTLGGNNGEGEDWALGAYSLTTGYPSTVSIHEGRVWFGSNANEPRRMDGSATGRFSPERISFQPFNQEGEVRDNHAISISIGGGDGSPITWSESTRNGLAVGTTNRVGMLTTNQNADAMTPGNASYKVISTTGCSKLKPFQMDNSLIFLNKVRRRLHELAYNIQYDGYVAPDMTELAEHLTRTGIKNMAYQQDPLNTLWVALTDGSLIALTYEKNADVVAWHRHVLGGTDVSVDSVAVIPSTDGSRDVLWLAVSRTIDGTTSSHVEQMTRWYEDDMALSDACYFDDSVSYSTTLNVITAATKADPLVITKASHTLSTGDIIIFENVSGMTELNGRYFKVASTTTDTATLDYLDNTAVDSTDFGTFVANTTGGYRVCTNTFYDLNHLEGETVGVYVDGRAHSNKTVTDGIVTLDSGRYGAVVQIGLPATWSLDTHRLEAGAADGTAQGKIKRMEEVIVRLRETLGFKYGPDTSDLDEEIFTNASVIGVPPTLFTGDVSLRWNGGYEREGYMHFESDSPYPVQIQAIMPSVSTQD